MLGRRHVLPSVCSTLTEIMVEGTFPTGTYLVTVHHPISSDDGDLAKALYGSFLPIPDQSIFTMPEDKEYEAERQPGAVVTVKGKVVLNEGRKRISLKVTSKGDRPIQVRYSFLSLCLEIERKAKREGDWLSIADWLALPFHRNESPARIRPRQSLRISTRHRSRDIRTVRAWRHKDRDSSRDWREQDHPRR